jgi:hypothetical protein
MKAIMFWEIEVLPKLAAAGNPVFTKVGAQGPTQSVVSTYQRVPPDTNEIIAPFVETPKGCEAIAGTRTVVVAPEENLKYEKPLLTGHTTRSLFKMGNPH